MKGIVLAGGLGTRLYPVTKAISKQLLPIYDKPMIYYPLSVLLLSGIRDILIISTQRDINSFIDLFGDGNQLGISLSYETQLEPKGLAEAFIIGERFINGDTVALALGDNIIFGNRLKETLQRARGIKGGAKIFGYYVNNPQNYGVLEIDELGKVISVEEKPENPKSNYAIPGLYFYDNNVIDIAKEIKPSSRGELEITSVNHQYLKKGELTVEILEKDIIWFDTGTCDGLFEASNYVRSHQKRTGIYIGCIEEIAYRMGYINKEKLERLALQNIQTSYSEYLNNLLS